ncbi:uncharacterized protein [Fopius arisanus]|uniref:Uncharacterized protein isoform X2 n=1 Tax=Fopius arisanus TaxID=64838 RepID=A0A9R1SVK4_9HYME|nr:PREDICTED: uncharacterized protein LOC105263394 isoform X2 [Fopius arisanus]
MERLGSSGQRRQDEGKSMRKAKKNDNEKSFFNGCQRWLKKPRRCTQTQLKKSMRKVPNFVIGTILPEPNDSLVLFPSKSHKDYWRATQGFSPDVNKLEVTMKKPGITRLTHNHPQITSPIENA